MRAPGRRLGVLLALLGLVASGSGLWTLRALEPARRAADALLYLPNGTYLELLSVGQAPLLADLIYIWAIQYYSDYGREDRFRYVKHVFRDVIAELDPHYVDAYGLGALILTVEARDLEGGLELLDKGFARNPDRWILPYLAAWECSRAGQLERAVRYFQAAAGVPGAPSLVRRMRAGMTARAGDVREALRLWRELRDDPASDDLTRAIASRQARDLQVRLDAAELEAAVRDYERRTGRPPARLEDLVRVGILRSLPVDPDGRPYVYDRRSGKVTSAAARLLGGA